MNWETKKWELPTSVEINGSEYAIRSDFRAVLDVMQIMTDQDISEQERGLLTLSIFYVDFDNMYASDFQEASEYMRWFINGGEEQENKRKPKLMDWEQDFPLIVAPVNRVLGMESRTTDYLHWWTFLSAYMEIGDCLFAQVVSIRRKLKKGKQLDKSDKEFYRRNKELVDFKVEETAEETDFFDEWIT